MGYRLEIERIGHKEPNFYGTKLYGYVDEKKLKSYNWLLKKGFLDKNTYYIWAYCCDNPITMKVKDFREFAVLYDEDLSKTGYLPGMFIEDETIKQILNLKDDELLLLTWG